MYLNFLKIEIMIIMEAIRGSESLTKFMLED